MFGFLKPDPARKLRKQYEAKLDETMRAQRSGDLRAYAASSAETDAIWRELEPLEKPGAR